MIGIKRWLSISLILSSSLYILSLTTAYADEGFRHRRKWYIDNMLLIMERTAERTEDSEKEKVVNNTLIWIELTLQWGVGIKGKQIFELLTVSEERLLSKLEWPLRGEMLILKGEVGSPFSRFSIGGKFGTSRFRRRTNTDEDWGFWSTVNDVYRYIDYQITYQDSKSKVDFFDANLYYHLKDWTQNEIRQDRLPSEKRTIFDNLQVDKLSLDIFVGYQYLKGRYRMIDPKRAHYLYFDNTWWYVTGLPADLGLDSFYKVRYRGPRIGFRLKSSSGKANARLSVAYALLRTNGYGWWNLRDLTFWHYGKGGYGIDIGCEVTYPFTSSLSGGLAYNYLYCRHDKLKESWIDPTYSHFDVNRIRNVNFRIYGPSFILRYIW